MKKRAGILFPISTLPSCHGIGDLGESAYALVNKMVDASLSLWQILPLHPLGYGNSPYQPLSSEAGDEIYLSLSGMVDDCLLTAEEVASLSICNERIDYDTVRKSKDMLYRRAFLRFVKTEDYERFLLQNEWVYDYAQFRVFKQRNHHQSWRQWESCYSYENRLLTVMQKELTQDVEYYLFLQYIFFKQWHALRTYANANGVTIIGDMPIYVGMDSVDVWANQEIFLLEKDGTPSFVAGVPPDYFSQYGQRWGNPLYDWEYLINDGFSFWIKRMTAMQNYYDIVRIDHFRAFDTYWKIPEKEPTAIIGEWVQAPGHQCFDTLFRALPNLKIWAEDLGDLRDEVYQLRDCFHLKGMYVFQFHYPCDFDFQNVVVYTGTHDNDTLVGWLQSEAQHQGVNIQEELSDYPEDNDYEKIIHYCLNLNAEEVIVPVWDIMGQSSESRLNTPGTVGSPNWEYCLQSFHSFDEALQKYATMVKASGRGRNG